MNEKAFRLDFAIAIAALLVSAAAAFALIYQTRVIAQQYAATIWPYLSVNSSYSPLGVTIQVANDGLGPALIDSAQLFIDDKAVPGWGTYLHDLEVNPALKNVRASISSSSFGRSTTIRPGDSKLLFAIAFKRTIAPGALTAHTVGVRLCYCSINNSCWNLLATPGNDSRRTPQPVSDCTENTMISSDLSYPSSPPRKK
ncbi:MAG TPA: hypothetical protein VMB20_06700 [Candidatus Acidoferrum sp.]|nr:hypothetical protein [Candidatus Acidoferrum sp.]